MFLSTTSYYYTRILKPKTYHSIQEPYVRSNFMVNSGIFLLENVILATNGTKKL